MHLECLGSLFCVQPQFMNHSSHNKNCASLTISSKDMAFIQMKYVAAIVVSMFRLQYLVEYLAMGNPNLILSLTTCMKGGFPVMLEKKKVDR